MYFNMATGRGVLTTWDWRFGIRVSNAAHPSRARIHRLVNSKAGLIAAIGREELSTWDIEQSEFRELWNISGGQGRRSCKVLFLCLAQNSCPHHVAKIYPFFPFSKAMDPPSERDYINNALVFGVNETSAESQVRAVTAPDMTSFIVSAGSDMRIRYLDLDTLDAFVIGPNGYECFLLGEILGISVCSAAYRFRHYIRLESDGASGNTVPSQIPASINKQNWAVSPQHNDSITDLAFTETPYPMLISSGRDGVVKVWR
jgi:phosphoinositide-3-kinase regulatory subunit 4